MEELFVPIKLQEVAADIFTTPFLNSIFVDTLHTVCKNNTQWTRNKKDKLYSTQDFFFSKSEEYKDIDFLLRSEIEEKVFSHIQYFWSFDKISISQIFAVKYSLISQKSLALHNDESFISMSIKLNNNYTGANLEFPRQNFIAETIPPGNLLIWPSKLTHPHRCSDLEKGEKYSITVWTDEK